MRKRIGALLLGLVLFVNGLSWEVLAADAGNGPNGQADPAQTVEQTWINPIYQDVEEPGSLKEALETEEEVSAPEGRAGAGETVTYLSMDKAAASLRSQLVARKSPATVYVNVGSMDIHSVASTLYQNAVSVGKGTAGNEGDYIVYHLGGYYSSTARASYYDPGRYIVTYTVSYYTTQQQERQMTTKVRSVLSALGVSKMSTYGKIKSIHDYICKNVRYDYDTLYDSSKGKYTAYNALMKKKAVCQGYASLFYRMATDAGLRVRVIPGSSRGVPHAWNIVKLGSCYYNLDSTWDAGVRTPQYFLKSNRDFPDHTRDQECLTAAFQKAYPMALTSYKANRKQQHPTVRSTSLNLYMGNGLKTLKVSNAKGKITYKSSNTKVVKVDTKGRVTPRSIGRATIAINIAGNDIYRPAILKVKVIVEGTDITAKYRAKTQKILRTFDNYLGYGCSHRTDFKYDIYARTTMLGMVNAGEIEGKSPKYAKNKLSNKMKLFFGTSSVKFRRSSGFNLVNTDPSHLIVEKNGKIRYTGGNWGDLFPVGKVKKVTKINAKNIAVTYKIYRHMDGMFMGTYKITMKKVKNKYGLIITDIERIQTT